MTPSAVILSRGVFLPLLTVAFAVIWALLAIAPHDRAEVAREV